MTGPQEDPDAMLANFRRQIDEKLQQADRMETAAAEIRVIGTSPDSSVRVTVDNTGNLTDLQLTQDALGRTPEEVSGLIVATLRQAQAGIADQVKEAMEPMLGADSQTMDMLMSGYHNRFGVEEEEPADAYDPQETPLTEPPTATTATNRDAPAPDDDFEQRDSWLDED